MSRGLCEFHKKCTKIFVKNNQEHVLLFQPSFVVFKKRSFFITSVFLGVNSCFLTTIIVIFVDFNDKKSCRPNFFIQQTA